MLHHDTRYLRNCIAELFLGHMLGEKHFCREPSNKKKNMTLECFVRNMCQFIQFRQESEKQRSRSKHFHLKCFIERIKTFFTHKLNKIISSEFYEAFEEKIV